MDSRDINAIKADVCGNVQGWHLLYQKNTKSLYLFAVMAANQSNTSLCFLLLSWFCYSVSTIYIEVHGHTLFGQRGRLAEILLAPREVVVYNSSCNFSKMANTEGCETVLENNFGFYSISCCVSLFFFCFFNLRPPYSHFLFFLIFFFLTSHFMCGRQLVVSCMI